MCNFNYSCGGHSRVQVSRQHGVQRYRCQIQRKDLKMHSRDDYLEYLQYYSSDSSTTIPPKKVVTHNLKFIVIVRPQHTFCPNDQNLSIMPNHDTVICKEWIILIMPFISLLHIYFLDCVSGTNQNECVYMWKVSILNTLSLNCIHLNIVCYIYGFHTFFVNEVVSWKIQITSISSINHSSLLRDRNANQHEPRSTVQENMETYSD